jgi:hypothetical protein
MAKKIEEVGNTVALNRKYYNALRKFHKTKATAADFEYYLSDLMKVPVKEKMRVVNILKRMKPRSRSLQ